MKVEATFTVYGEHVEDLTEAAYEQGVKFFRCLDDELEITDLIAKPVVSTAEGEVTRWRAQVTMKKKQEEEQ